jgi:hypothetical protein
MATITRTVMSGLEHSAYVSVDSKPVVPECITRFGSGTRVEIRKLRGAAYAVQALEGDLLRVFGEETWRSAV